jgi:hypothetical protein
MNEQARSAPLQEHEVLFLDFLGFATAVQHWDDERMGELIAVLAGIADAQSDFDIRRIPKRRQLQDHESGRNYDVFGPHRRELSAHS